MVTPEKRSQDEREITAKALTSPGEQLRHAREAIGTSLSVIAARTKISETTLFHLENDMFDEFAVELFLKGHLRSYARELGLEPDAIIRSYEVYIGAISYPSQSYGTNDCNLDADSIEKAKTTHMSHLRASDTSSTVRDSQSSQADGLNKSQPLRVSVATKRSTQQAPTPKISSAALSGAHRKVIGRFDSQGPKSNVRRGPTPTDAGKTSAVSGTRQLFAIADRIFNRQTDANSAVANSDAQSASLRERLNGSTPAAIPSVSSNLQRLRRSSQALTINSDPDAGKPKSKLERAIPHLKEFGAKHFIAIIVAIVCVAIVAGLLSGNRATAQDPAKFPKNSQDSWELERQADQTRWLLEQPDGQIESSKEQH